MKRKIAAIIAADVAGYSRLVEENEEDTLRRFIDASYEFKSLVQGHHGRIFNTAGDAILAEFPSPVEAVRCAAGIQTRMRELNRSHPKDRQLLFRIGVSIGDVIEHENDLLGDGVNIAARLQTLASPGGLSISHWVHEQISGKIQLEFRDAGSHSVKNIAKPVHVFLADIGTTNAPFASGQGARLERPSRGVQRTVILSAASMIAVFIAVFVWQRATHTSPSSVTPAVTSIPAPTQASEPNSLAPAPAPTPVATPPVTQPAARPVEAALPPPAPLPAAQPAPVTPARPSEPAAAIAEPLRLPWPTQAQPSPNRARSSTLCAEIRERAQIGDITTDERSMLRTDCK